MGIEQANDPADPYSLDGKNVRRVIPQVHRSIRIQRLRIRAHLIAFVACVVLGLVGCWFSGVWLGIGCILLLISPVALVGVFADRHLLKWHQQRLAECERRSNAQQASKSAAQPPKGGQGS